MTTSFPLCRSAANTSKVVLTCCAGFMVVHVCQRQPVCNRLLPWKQRTEKGSEKEVNDYQRVSICSCAIFVHRLKTPWKRVGFSDQQRLQEPRGAV